MKYCVDFIILLVGMLTKSKLYFYSLELVSINSLERKEFAKIAVVELSMNIPYLVLMLQQLPTKTFPVPEAVSTQ